MKKLLIMGLMLFVVSCGKDGGGGTSPQTEVSGTNSVEEVRCAVKFYKSDTPIVIAQKANQARIECKLTEEQLLWLVNHAK